MAEQEDYTSALDKIINDPDAQITTGDLEGAFGFVDTYRAFENLTARGMILYGLHQVHPGVAAHALGLTMPSIPNDPFARLDFYHELKTGECCQYLRD